MKTIFIKEAYSNDYNFDWFKQKGFNVKSIENENDFSFIDEIKVNDILFIHFFQYDKIIDRLDKSKKIIIFIYIAHEWIDKNVRLNILKNNPNYIIYFITLHIDEKTLSNDLPIESKCFTFHKIINTKDLPNQSKRNKKYNFFNRTISLLRLKIFELLKKQNFNFDGYYTFGNLLMANENEGEQYVPAEPIGMKNIKSYMVQGKRNKVARTIKEFVELRKKSDYEIDVDYINSKKNEFVFLGNIQHYQNRIMDEIHLQTAEGDLINQYSLDSYISFIIESSDNIYTDLRISEKTIRAYLCKNIILPIQHATFSECIRKLGLKTFDDVFGLKEGWDNEPSDIKRIEIFISALNKINEMSLEQIEEIYNRKDIQERLEHNYKIIKNGFNENFVYNQLYEKILLTSNKILV